MSDGSIFPKHFNDLLDGGVHILSSTLDSSKELQVAEFYGAKLDPKEQTLRLLLNQADWAEFTASMNQGHLVAVVFSSPLTMMTYQVKGRVIKKDIPSESDFDLLKYWEENFFQCIKLIGVSSYAVENLDYKIDTIIELKIESIFYQTPKPGSGGLIEN